MNKEFLIKNKYWIILGLIIIVSVLLRIFPLRLYPFWDETIYLQHAEIMFSGRTNYSELSFRAPFLSIIFYLGYLIWHNVILSQIIVSLLQGVGIFFIYLLGKEIYNEKIGLLCAAFLGLFPFYIHLGNMLLPGMVSVTFMIISFYLLIKKENYAFFAGIFAAVAGLTKHPALFLPVIYIIMFLIRRIKFKQGIYLVLGFSATMLPYFIWAQIKFGFFLKPFLTHATRNLDVNLTSNLVLYLNGFREVFGGIILFGFLLYFFTKRDKYKEIFIAWIILFLGIMLILHAESRYLIHIVPFLLLMSAKGYVNFFKKYYYLIIILILIFGIVSYMNFYDFNPGFVRETSVGKEDLKEVVEVSKYLKENSKESDVIYTHDNYPIIAYYTNREVRPIWLVDEFKGYYRALLNESGYFVYFENKREGYSGFFDDHFVKVIKIDNTTIYEVQPSEPFK